MKKVTCFLMFSLMASLLLMPASGLQASLCENEYISSMGYFYCLNYLGLYGANHIYIGTVTWPDSYVGEAIMVYYPGGNDGVFTALADDIKYGSTLTGAFTTANYWQFAQTDGYYDGNVQLIGGPTDVSKESRGVISPNVPEKK